MSRLQRLPLFLFAIGLTLSACSDDRSPTPSQTPAVIDAPALLLTKKVMSHYFTSAATPNQYALSKRRQDSFQYDDKNRLVYIDIRNPDQPDYSYAWGRTSYQYVDRQLIYSNLLISPQVPITYTLNERGHITQDNTYNADGYLTYRQQSSGATTTQTIVGGNIVKQIYQDKLGRQTITYEYDLSKPGLPNPEEALSGRPSRNLVIKETQVNESFSGVPSIAADHMVTSYTYAYDARGVVKQQTALIESRLTAQPTLVDRELKVTDYEFK